MMETSYYRTKGETMGRVINEKKKDKEIRAEYKDYQAFMVGMEVFVVKNDGTYKGSIKLSHPYEKPEELENLLEWLFQNNKLK